MFGYQWMSEIGELDGEEECYWQWKVNEETRKTEREELRRS